MFFSGMQGEVPTMILVHFLIKTKEYTEHEAMTYVIENYDKVLNEYKKSDMEGKQ